MYARFSLTKRYGDQMFAGDDRSKRVVKNAVYAGTIITHYRTQHANFQQPTPWRFPVRRVRRRSSSTTTATFARASCGRNSRRSPISITASARCGLRMNDRRNSRQSTAGTRVAHTSVSFTARCATRVAPNSTTFPRVPDTRKLVSRAEEDGPGREPKDRLSVRRGYHVVRSGRVVLA